MALSISKSADRGAAETARLVERLIRDISSRNFRIEQTVNFQPTFTDIYVFPDGELPPIATTLLSAEESGFEVRGVENLREHYDFTTRHWLRRLEANAEPRANWWVTNAIVYGVSISPDRHITSKKAGWVCMKLFF